MSATKMNEENTNAERPASSILITPYNQHKMISGNPQSGLERMLGLSQTGRDKKMREMFLGIENQKK